MSDSTKTILWIVLAVIVVAIVAVLVVRTSRKRRELDERRFKAVDLRAQAQQQTPVVQQRADRASVTEKIAAEARVEADEKVAVATTLEDQARTQRAAASGAAAERDDLAREADRVDPDVETDAAGHRVDDSEVGREGADGDATPDDVSNTGHDTDDAHDTDHSVDTDDTNDGAHTDRAGRGSGEQGATAAGGVLAGASTLDDHDDEPDLADAEDPFAAGMDEPSAEGYEGNMEQTNDSNHSNDSNAEPAAIDPKASGPEATDSSATESTSGPGGATGATGADSADASTGDHADTAKAASIDEPAADHDTKVDEQRDEKTSDRSVSEPVQESSESTSGPAEVSVPALDDRDDVLVGGGPPDNDPGDHRGQPWATTPGEPGLDEGDDLADNTNEGFAAHPPADAAPDDADQPAQGETDHADAENDADADADNDADTITDDADGSDEGDRSDNRVTPDQARSTSGGSSDENGVGDHGGRADHDTESGVADSGGATTVEDTAPDSGRDLGGDRDLSSNDDDDDAGEATEVVPADTSHDAAPADTTEEPAETRISTFDEVIDGGYGIGSAQPIDDGAQPLGHPVKARHDLKSFVAPGEAGYEDGAPDVWFFNEDAARRAGFSRQGEHDS